MHDTPLAGTSRRHFSPALLAGTSRRHFSPALLAGTSRRHFSPALLALAAFGMAAVPATAQQLNLQSGDNVTVSGTGTIGTYRGQPIANGTTSYSETANRNTNISTSGSDPNSTAVTVNINSTFNLQNGGSLTASGTNGFGLDALFGATVNITGGTITSTGRGVRAQDSTLNFSGGSISSGGLSTEGVNANVTISGGSISGSIALNAGGGTINVTGGNITSSGGSFGSTGLLVGNNSIIDLFGTNFRDGNGNAFTGPITSGSGTIMGTLLNGQTINTTYTIGNVSGGTIEFNVAATPEPSQFASLGLGALCLGGLVLRARRRKAVAA